MITLGAGLGACPAHPESPSAPRPAGETEAGARRCQRWTLVVVCLASGVLLFNVTAPNVALPAIADDLGADFSAQQWVLSAYALVLASLLLAGGAIGDRYGRRRWFLVGLAVFGAGSLACALAPTPVLLVLGRVVQGLGAAVVFPSGLALIAAEFTGAARARAIGIWGASVAGAIALGPLLGGVLVEVSGWRAQFGLAVVLAIPALLIGARHLRESREATGRLDWLGTGLLTGSLTLLIVLVQRAGQIGWGHWATITMAAGSAILLVAFVLAEHRVRSPLIAPALMRSPTFLGATMVALVFAAAGFAPLVYISLFLLQVTGSGPILAGLQVAPFALTSLAVSLVAARVVERLGTRIALAGGLALCGVGVALMLGVDADSGGLRLLAGLLVFGAGAGVVNPTMTVAALSTVTAAHSGMASGVNNTARQIGIAAGIAALGAVLQARLSDGVRDGLLDRGVAPEPAGAAADLAAGGDLAAATARVGPAGPEVSSLYAAAFAAGLNTVFVIALGITVLGIVATLILIRPNATGSSRSDSSRSDSSRDRETPVRARFQVVGNAGGEPTDQSCAHLDQIVDVEPSTRDGCEDCLREGTRWVHLRECLQCGHVGCCDNSPRRHATGHWESSSHPLIRSVEPGEDWAWCYPDELLLEPRD